VFYVPLDNRCGPLDCIRGAGIGILFGNTVYNIVKSMSPRFAIPTMAVRPAEESYGGASAAIETFSERGLTPLSESGRASQCAQYPVAPALSASGVSPTDIVRSGRTAPAERAL
jgi:hypothetical protein